MIGTPAGLPRRPITAEGEKRPISAAGIRQEFEGHGIAVLPALERGYIDGPARPATAPRDTEPGGSSTTPDSGQRRRKKREPVPRLIIHVHLREKTMAVNAGSGAQCVFWLGVTGVQRYLVEPESYTRPYSEELTPKGVLSEDGAWLETTSRIKDELKDGDHVWIDVGDGVPLSVVSSRVFQHPKYARDDDDGVTEEITWECDKERQPRMSYVRTPKLVKRQSTFVQWKKECESQQQDLWQMFISNFEQMHIDDLPGANDYREEIKGVLWKHFEPIAYMFHVYASKGNTGAGGNAASGQGLFTMSLQEFWLFCKDCHIPTPYLNLAKIDLLFITVDSKNRNSPHNPARAFVLAEFLEGLVRLSVLKQKGTKNAADANMSVPDCIDAMMQDCVLKYGLESSSMASATEVRASLNTQMVRRVIKLHESAMKKIFRKHAKADKNKETMELQEFLDLFHASGTVDSRGGPLTPKRVQETFILSQLDEGMVEVWRTAKDPCTTLIFPEFMEAIGRAALFKFEVDKISTVERKMHEMCQLVIASPVGKVSGAQPQAAPNPTTPARSERRRAIMPEMAGQSMHSVLKYKPAEGAPA